MLLRRLKAATFVFSLCTGFLLESGWSADWYVSADGSNNDSGDTQSTPFATMTKAMSMAAPGDTVYVMNGIYRNSDYGSGIDGSNLTNGNVLRITTSGSPGAPITLRNLEGHKPKIQFDGAGAINFAPNTSYITVEGFEIEGPSQSITYDQAIADRSYKIAVAEDDDANTSYQNNYFSGRGIYGYGPHSNIIVRNNIVHDTPGSGIRFNDSDYMTIEYNEVYNTTWWTSSASSAIVYAESIALDGDNGSDIKMIMRGNVVYNNWNRIPFYVTQLPDNAGGPGGDYGTASQDYILDGQGLYVTRSDPSYAGTFLFENNLLVNNGKNGINFDHSGGARAIFRNNTLYFNGVHNIIQDLSVADGNPRHVGGNKVAGILANDVTSAVVANNIVVTRDSDHSALTFRNFSNKVVTNNIFRNGTTPDNFPPTVLNVDPKFVSVPATIIGLVDLTGTDFSLKSDSPAINAGNPNYSASLDINKNKRPEPSETISSTSFESSVGGWTQFGSSIQISDSEAKTGSKSLYTNSRTANYSSPRLYLDGLVTNGSTYNFSVWVKLAFGASGTAQMVLKKTDDGVDEYINITSAATASDQNWIELSGTYTHTDVDTIFLYIKGPLAGDGLGNYYIDDFYVVPEGSAPIDFSVQEDVVDLGAYEYLLTDSDGDGVTDVDDNCVAVANADQLDTDDDSTGNACDDDDDGDGVNDDQDAFPLDETETTDTDSDGVGDNTDNCLSIVNEDQLDTDSDGFGNACDDDDDGDGVNDDEDAFPLNGLEWLDNDGDLVGNNQDEDDDNDGVVDSSDNCPLNTNEDQTDTDNDGLGNPCDSDDDGDGVPDDKDAFPLDESESIDTDSDGVGDNSDAFPNNAKYKSDSDSDGMPDIWELIFNLDPNDSSDAVGDLDGDGISNLQEFLDGTPAFGSIDIDGNQRYDALTDGLLILRGMFGLSGDALLAGATADDSNFDSPEEIETQFDALEALLDIDDDSNVDALTDGLLVLRYLFGLRGEALTAGVVDLEEGNRTTVKQIENYLSDISPVFEQL